MKKYKIVSAYLTKDNLEKIDVYAKEINQSRNEFITNVLLDYMKNKNKKSAVER